MKYIGLDAHSRECVFVVLGKNGKTLRRATVATKETELLTFVRSVKGKKALTFEEGTMSQWLYLLLVKEVNELIVCQPKERQGPKTDEIDAGEIADLLRVGRLKAVFHSDSAFMDLRTLISGYEDVIVELVRAKNRYKALFRQVGIPATGSKVYGSEEMLPLLKTDTQIYVACTLFEQIDLLEKQREGYFERFEANVRKYKPIKLLTSIPGIGPVRANQIVGVVVTPHRFPSKYKFFSYSMLTKHIQTSGGKSYGNKRAHGQVVLKTAFKSAAISTLRSKNAFRRKYDSMRESGSDDRAARNAVAKKIAATVLGVWKSGQKYNDKHKEVTRRRSQNCHSGV